MTSSSLSCHSQGPMHKDEYEAKHETHLIHDGSPSYDPGVYGGTYPHRFHIKTVQVCLRCVHRTCTCQ